MIAEPALDEPRSARQTRLDRVRAIPGKARAGVAPEKHQLIARPRDHFQIPRSAVVALDQRHRVHLPEAGPKGVRSVPGHAGIIAIAPEMRETTRRERHDQFEVAYAPESPLDEIAPM